jgi:hypothetical protein
MKGYTFTWGDTFMKGYTFTWGDTFMKGYTKYHEGLHFYMGGYTFSWGDVFVWATLSRRDTLLYGRHFYTERHFRYLLLSVVIYSDVLPHFYMEHSCCAKISWRSALKKSVQHLHRIPQSHRALSGWLGSSFVS